MPVACLVLLPVLAAALELAFGSEARRETTPTKARVAWLGRHVTPVRSLDLAAEDFTDLEPLRQAVGEARIVFLSEEWHGSGATFRARARVIKFLHEKCGFDLLAFERLNPASAPPTIDLMVTEGGSHGQTMLGSYDVSAERFRVCYAAPGRDRPWDFAPQAGSGHTFQKLKRASP